MEASRAAAATTAVAAATTAAARAAWAARMAALTAARRGRVRSVRWPAGRPIAASAGEGSRGRRCSAPRGALHSAQRRARRGSTAAPATARRQSPPARPRAQASCTATAVGAAATMGAARATGGTPVAQVWLGEGDPRPNWQRRQWGGCQSRGPADAPRSHSCASSVCSFDRKRSPGPRHRLQFWRRGRFGRTRCQTSVLLQVRAIIEFRALLRNGRAAPPVSRARNTCVHTNMKTLETTH